MFKKLKDKFVGFVLKKYVLGHIVAFYEKAEGYKSQVLLSLAGVAYASKFLGYTDSATSDKIVELLLAAAGVTLSEKLVRFKKIADEFREKNAYYRGKPGTIHKIEDDK